MQYSLQACRLSILVTYLRLIEGAIKGIGVGTGGGGGAPSVKVTGMLAVSRLGVICRFWSHLGCL